MTETAQGLARARTMLDLKRHGEAASLLASIVATDPGNGAAWCLLTLAHLGAGRNTDAAATAERVPSVCRPGHAGDEGELRPRRGGGGQGTRACAQ